MSKRTVLAVDVGSSTITAAVAGGDNDEPHILRPAVADAWPAAVFVAADGSLITNEDRHGQAASTITRVTRMLGKEAQVIGGECRHADTLISAALTPVLSAATRLMGENIELVVATYPSTWPEPVVNAYRHAIGEFAPAQSQLLPWADAATAATRPPEPFVDCPVTSLDFGARSATVTMARVTAHGKAKNEYSITNPFGGFAAAAQPVIAEIAHSLGVEAPAQHGDDAWWEQSLSAFAAARTNPRAAWAAPGPFPAGSMIVDFPAPLGLVNLNYTEVTELLVEQLTQPQGVMLNRAGFAPPTPGRAEMSLLEQLLNRGPVQARWTVPGNPHAARPIVELTGGFALDPALKTAVQEVAATEPMVDSDAAYSAAYGAAVLAERAAGRLIGSAR